jgi:hypothetical protein
MGAAQIWSIQGSPIAPKLRSSATALRALVGIAESRALSANLSATERPRSEREYKRHRAPEPRAHSTGDILTLQASSVLNADFSGKWNILT